MRITKKKIALWSFGLILLAGATALAFMPRPVSVDMGQVVRGPFRVTKSGVARTRVLDRYVVSAPVSGHLARIALRAGDSVSAGQEITRIVAAASAPVDPRTRAELQARVRAAQAAESESLMAIERARIATAQANRDLERSRLLRQEQALPQARLEEVESLAETRTRETALAELAAIRARRELEVARAALSDARAVDPRGGLAVHAPVAGRVLRVLTLNEGPVAAGTPLIEMGDPAALEVAIELPTADAVLVRPAAEVELVRWGGQQPLAGIVRWVEPSGFTKLTALGIEEQRVNVLVDPRLPDPRWTSIGDGYQMDARITVYQRTDILRLPVGALFRHGSQWAAFVVEQGRVRRRELEIGHKSETEAEVTSGLKDGDTVILYPGDQVHEGQRVVPRGRG